MSDNGREGEGREGADGVDEDGGEGLDGVDVEEGVVFLDVLSVDVVVVVVVVVVVDLGCSVRLDVGLFSSSSSG